jgi:hypothetical membrane protein
MSVKSFDYQSGALCGVIGPIIGFTFIAIAIILSTSWFNWWTNALSDLGHPWMLGGINGIPGFNPAASIFNGGMMFTGLISTIFGAHLIYLFWQHRDLFGLSGSILFVSSMVFLIAVGIFHEGILLPHALAAMGFFLTIFLSSIFMGLAFLRRLVTRNEGIIAITMGIIITITLFVGFSKLAPWTGVAIPEIIMAIAAFIWVIPASIRLYRYGYTL